MSLHPLLTIAIPTYNRPFLLKDCLQSLLDINLKEYINFLVLVSDNSENDDSQEIVHSFSHLLDIKYKKNKENIGAGKNTILFLESTPSGYLHIVTDKTRFNTSYTKIIPLLSISNNNPIFLEYGAFIRESEYVYEKKNEDLSHHIFSFDEGVTKLSYKITNLASLIYNFDEYQIKDCPSDYSDSLIPQAHIFVDQMRLKNELVIVKNETISVGETVSVGYSLFEVFYEDLTKLLYSRAHKDKLSFYGRIKSYLKLVRWLIPVLFKIEDSNKFQLVQTIKKDHNSLSGKFFHLIFALVNDVAISVKKMTQKNSPI